MPEITVVITTYNLQKYINPCLEELFSQTFQNFDVVIVDDCSKDNTQTIIQEWQARCPDRIKTIFCKENLGLPALTRNKALDSGLIDGNYILFLDGDDSIEPDMLEKLHSALIKRDAGVAICAYDRIEIETGHILCREMGGFPSIVEMPPTDDTLAFINTSLWNKLWRRDIFEEGRFPAFKVGEEVTVQYNGYIRCKRIAFVDEVLIHYKVHADSVISNTQVETVYQFAEDLRTCYQQQAGMYKDCLGLIIFLHIGISMAFRIADNPNANLDEHLKWTRKYLSENFFWFKENPYLKLRKLKHHGIKGVILWVALIAYKCNTVRVVVAVYQFIVKRLHFDIKF